MEWNTAERREIADALRMIVQSRGFKFFLPFFDANGHLKRFGLNDTFPQSIDSSSPELLTASPEVLSDYCRLYQHTAFVSQKHGIAIEYLLRSCEIRHRDLRSLLQKNGTNDTDLQLRVQLLRVLFLLIFFHTDDPRFINIALKITDGKWVISPEHSLRKLQKKLLLVDTEWAALAGGLLLSEAIERLRSANWLCPNITRPNFSKPQERAVHTNCNAPIVIFSPSRKSLYAMAMMTLLKKQGVKIGGVLIRRMFNLKRFTTEFKRDGLRLVHKVWKKLVLGKSAYSECSFPTLATLLKEENVLETSIEPLGKRLGIPVQYCETFNSSECHAFLESISPKLVAFTGGGIVRDKTIQRSGDGILNCHMGSLPYFRGMDVVEWPLLNNRCDCLGFTIHFMDSGIDTGDILNVLPQHRLPRQSIEDLRNMYEEPMAKGFAGTIVNWLNNDATRTKQPPDSGKQHFIMHSKLRTIMEQRFESVKNNTH